MKKKENAYQVEMNKLSLFADDKVCVENLRDFYQENFLEQSKFGRFARYKINTQNTIVFLYMNNENVETKMKKVPSTISQT